MCHLLALCIGIIRNGLLLFFFFCFFIFLIFKNGLIKTIFSSTASISALDPEGKVVPHAGPILPQPPPPRPSILRRQTRASAVYYSLYLQVWASWTTALVGKSENCLSLTRVEGEAKGLPGPSWRALRHRGQHKEGFAWRTDPSSLMLRHMLQTPDYFRFLK